MESSYKNTSKIRNVTFIFQNKKKTQKIEKKSRMDYKKSIKLFEIKKG